MQAQRPAEGVLLQRDFGDAKSYKVTCECGQDWHAHDLWVEADETGVTVGLDVTVKSNYWDETVAPSYAIDNPWLQEFNWALCSFVNGQADVGYMQSGHSGANYCEHHDSTTGP